MQNSHLSFSIFLTKQNPRRIRPGNLRDVLSACTRICTRIDTHTHTDTHSTTFSSNIHSLRELRADVDANEKVCKSFPCRVVACERKPAQTFLPTPHVPSSKSLPPRRFATNVPWTFILARCYNISSHHISRPSQMQNNTSPPIQVYKFKIRGAAPTSANIPPSSTRINMRVTRQ